MSGLIKRSFNLVYIANICNHSMLIEAPPALALANSQTRRKLC